MSTAQELAREKALEVVSGAVEVVEDAGGCPASLSRGVLEALEAAGLVVRWRDAQALEDTVTEGLRQGDRVRHSSGWTGEVMWSRVHYLHTDNAGNVRVLRTLPGGHETARFIREDRRERITEELA